MVYADCLRKKAYGSIKAMIWNTGLAYAIGLISTDGSLSKDGRHIILTSKDFEQIETFTKLLDLKNKIGTKNSSFNKNKLYYQVQFGNKKFYKFLLKIGLFANKTKTLGSLKIPKKFFPDFLRGVLDGDGYTYSYWDKRWKKSFMFYTGIVSASKKYLEWINNRTSELYGIEGKIPFQNNSIFRLLFAKKASINLSNKLYYRKDLPCLERKRQKIFRAIDIVRNISRDAGTGRQAALRRQCP